MNNEWTPEQCIDNEEFLRLQGAMLRAGIVHNVASNLEWVVMGNKKELLAMYRNIKAPEVPTTVEDIFDLLNRKFVQRSDYRQKQLGLQYMDAETHDLAEELHAWLKARGVV